MEDETKQLEQTALAWPRRAEAITIVDQPTYNQAAQLLLDIAVVEKKIIDHHAPVKAAAFAAHKAAVAAEKRLLDPLTQAKTIIKREIGEWERKQEAIRLEIQRKAEAEQRRLDEEARLAVAVQAEAAGAPVETVNEILEMPVVTAPVVVAPTFQRTQGIITRENWHAEVIDLKALCKSIAEGRASQELVLANMPALNGMARAMKQTLNIPGVRAVPETSVAVKRAV